MWTRRTVWAAAVLAAFALYLFDNNGGTRAVLLTVLLVPLLSAGSLLLFKPKLEAALEVPETVERGESVPCTLILTSRGALPITWAECAVEIENLLTGERGEVKVSVGLSAGETARTPIRLTVNHCGALVVRTGALRVMDFFGLAGVRPDAAAQARTLVPPKLLAVEAAMGEEPDLFADSRHYSTRQAGNDPSETFQIRDYAPGDPIRRIHWKLTEKLDKPLVRDFGLPRESRLRLSLEAADVGWSGTDQALDLLFSAGAALCDQELPCTVRYPSPEGEITLTLCRREEWSEFRQRLLQTRMEPVRLRAEGLELRTD